MALKHTSSTATSEWKSGSMVSEASTEASSSMRGSFLGSDLSAASTIEGWCYWRKERECWLKVYVVLRNELLFLTRSEQSPRPLIQIAVTWVTMSSIGGFCVEGPSGEKMDLYLYEQDNAWLWYNSLVEAAGFTKNLEQTLADGSHMPKNIRRSASLMYSGTLVQYQQENSGANRTKVWKAMLSATRLRTSWKKRVERLIDRLDGSSMNN